MCCPFPTKLGLPLSKTKMCIKPYGSKTMKCVGYYMGAVMHSDTVAIVGIYVVDKEVETLLSGPACEALGMISFHGENTAPSPNAHCITGDKSVQHILAKYPMVFKGIGKLKNYQVKLHIDENIPPVASPLHPEPFHLKQHLCRELDKMEEAGIIEDLMCVLAPKENGDVQVTVDMRCPNQAIKDTYEFQFHMLRTFQLS